MKTLLRVALWSFLLAACAADDGIEEEPDYGRALHWVIRSSRLDVSLNFTRDVLGMKVLRHEEHANSCEITRNGGFDGRWSKTTVGFTTEDVGYALEITYNYGVDKYDYEAGSGLRRFVFTMPSKAYKRVKKMASRAAWHIREPPSTAFGDRFVITGPDGYMFEVRLNDVGRKEYFYEAVLTCADPMKLADWYQDHLHMVQVSVGGAVDHPPRSVAVAYPTLDPIPQNKQEAVRLVFEWERESEHKWTGGRKPNLSPWAGRSALALSDAKVRALHAKLADESPELIVHDLVERSQIDGTHVMFVMRDPMGYEIAVHAEGTFNTMVAAATTYVGPDWAKRAEHGETLTPWTAQEEQAHARIVDEKDEL